MNRINSTKFKNKFFYKIYECFLSVSPSLAINTYFISLMPFLKADTSTSSLYNRIKRYLIDYWRKEDGKIESDKRWYKELSNEVLKINPSSSRFLQYYKNNVLIELLINNPSLSSSIISIVQEAMDLKQIRRFPIDSLSTFAEQNDYAHFLFYLIKSIYTISAPDGVKESPLSSLLRLLEQNHISVEQLENYTRNVLLKSGTEGTNAQLEILKITGFPNHINRKCSPLFLLAASDLYYFHKMKSSKTEIDGYEQDKNDNIKDIKYAYLYSKAAFDYWRSPSAAYNMANTIYLCSSDPHLITSFTDEIPDLLEIDDNHENVLIKAFEYFRFAAESSFADAFNSIGKICAQILTHYDEFPILSKLIYDFSKSIFSTIETKLPYTFNEQWNQESSKIKIYECEKLMYECSSHLNSLNGTSNLYNLLLKEMADGASGDLIRFKEKYQIHIQLITQCINKLCDYRLPSAMTDYATLCLHKNRINNVMQKNQMKYNGKIINEFTPYDLIYPYCNNSSNGKLNAIRYLTDAAQISKSTFQSPWPSYYLYLIAFESMNYKEAYKRILEAKTIADKMHDINPEYKYLFEKKSNELKKKI